MRPAPTIKAQQWRCVRTGKVYIIDKASDDHLGGYFCRIKDVATGRSHWITIDGLRRKYEEVQDA